MRINSLSFSFLVCVMTLTGGISFGKPAKNTSIRTAAQIREAMKLFDTIEAHDEEAFLKANSSAKIWRPLLRGAKSYTTGDIRGKYKTFTFGDQGLIMCSFAEPMEKAEAVALAEKLVARLGKPDSENRDAVEKQGFLFSCAWELDKGKHISYNVTPSMGTPAYAGYIGLTYTDALYDFVKRRNQRNGPEKK